MLGLRYVACRCPALPCVTGFTLYRVTLRHTALPGATGFAVLCPAGPAIALRHWLRWHCRALHHSALQRTADTAAALLALRSCALLAHTLTCHAGFAPYCGALQCSARQGSTGSAVRGAALPDPTMPCTAGFSWRLPAKVIMALLYWLYTPVPCAVLPSFAGFTLPCIDGPCPALLALHCDTLPCAANHCNAVLALQYSALRWCPCPAMLALQ
jgi:hypothetical protein